MGDQRDRPGGQRVGLDVADGAQPAGDVHEPHAPGAAHRHARLAGDRGQPVPQPGGARKVKGRTENYGRTGLGACRGVQLRLEGGVRDGQQHEVHRFGQLGQAGQAGRAFDVVVPRVDQVGARARRAPGHLRDHARAEAARPRAGPDQRHGAGLEHRGDGSAATVTAGSDGACDGAVTGGGRAGQPGRARGGRTAEGGAAVGDRGPGRLHAGDAADPAAGVGGGAGVVQAGHRGAVVGEPGRGAHVEQLLQGQLAVEDVAADQAVVVLHLVRAHDVGVQDRALEVRRHLVVAVDHAVGVGLQFLGVRFFAPVGRDPLGEQRHDVVPLRAQRRVEGGRDDPVAERPGGGPALARVLERALDVRHGRRHLHRTRVVFGQVGAGIGGEVGEFGQRQVDLDDAAAGLPVLDVGDEVIGQVLAADVVQERGARVQRGDHDLGRDLPSVLEDDPCGPAVFEQQLAYPGAGADLGAVVPGGAGDRVGDRAHAALLEAPVAQVAVADVADRVVRHHVGGARLVGPGPGADHAVDRQRALDLRRGEPVVEQVGDRHRHQPGHVGDGAHVQAALAPGQPQRLGQVAGLVRAEVRRHGEQQRAEHLGQPGQPGVPARHRVGVLLRPAGDLVVVALGVVGVELDRPAFGEGLVVRAHREDLVAVLFQPQVADDGRRHQRHHVGQAGDAEVRGVRPGSLGGRGAAGLRPRLEHQRPGAGAGQVRRGDQAVVPAADDDRVVVRGAGRSARSRRVRCRLRCLGCLGCLCCRNRRLCRLGRNRCLGCLRCHGPGPPKD